MELLDNRIHGGRGKGNSKVVGRTTPEAALGLSNMLGQRISGRSLALPSSGGDGLGGGEGGGKCSVGGNHISGAEGGGDRRGGGVDGHGEAQGQSTDGFCQTRARSGCGGGCHRRRRGGEGGTRNGGVEPNHQGRRHGTRKEGALAAANPPKGEEKALAVVSSPHVAEPSGSATGKREEGAPVAASSPPAAEPSGGAAGKREEATGAVKAKQEAWWLILGNVTSSELYGLKRIYFVDRVVNTRMELPQMFNIQETKLILVSDCYLGFDQEYSLGHHRAKGV
ncbi:hypothetical protein GUJ93_ZPchr0013g34060 [Zizania palustris]|uniref:SEC63 domain-containing protein n=1 Tax=Zizania palustris TaxID=103762 RepID=A0A8J5WRF9_ZIZPA|nr:hypothetical protein GUJ93_ZPchr0013g34060 [Zizania palustris]